ncbi:Sialidase like protein [Argiope bruennichi]|uniref:Sialidase like protein n=2 Tax=Argiope bruennichi TaxID=94029 RepID=A0A8T0EQJ3_ARGBR|nr:Sialidase like protein [Argiope bruennichi]
MERNGDVATEFNSCHSENFCLNTSLFKTGCDKMCKDDNSESLFCKMSGKMRSDNIMASGFEDEHEISLSALQSQCLEKLSRSETDFINSDEHILSVIHQKTEDAMNNCLIPIWEEESAKLCNNPLSLKPPENFLLSDDSLVNGDKAMNDSENSFKINSNCIGSNAVHNSDSSLGATSDSLQQAFVEELSSSSIEEILVSSPMSGNFSKIRMNNVACHDSKGPDIIQAQNSPNNLSSLSFTIPKLEMVKEIESSPKSEMPELIPTGCLDDENVDDESMPSMEQKNCEKANVADSPEMPKLVPFSTDIEDIMKIKKEHLNNEHKSDSYQLLTSAKRKLFLQYEMSPVINVKKSKSNIELNECVSMNNSPEAFTLEDSISYPSEALGSEKGTYFKKEDDKKFENPDFRNFFSEMNRNLKLLSESYKRSEDIETKCSPKPSIEPEIDFRKLSLDNYLLINSTDKRTFLEAADIEDEENENKFSFKHCLPTNDSDDNDSLASKPECLKYSYNEVPEVEEIEGMRFFQFRSKHTMDEFLREPPKVEISLEMIVPTKTTDITQIKGWRNKYFAPDSQLQLSCAKSESNIDECSQNAVSLPPLSEQVDIKTIDFCIQDNDEKAESSQENKNLSNLKCLATGSQSLSVTSTPMKSNSDEKGSLLCSKIFISTPIKSDVEGKDSIPIKSDVKERHSTPVKLDVERKDSTPIKPNVVGKDSTPKKPDEEGKDSTPVKPNVERKDSTPIKLNVERKDSTPIKPNVEGKDSETIKSDIEGKDSTPIKPDVKKKESTPIKPDVEKKESTPIKPDVEKKESTPIKPDVEKKESTPIKLDVEGKDKICPVEISKSEESVSNNPMSAFVSKRLDDFLLNSSTLNITFLQKANPNIKSIPPDAPILSIGKLRKMDDDSNVPYKTKFVYKVRDERDRPTPSVPTTTNLSAPVITLSSTDESSSDDDIPVADLYSKGNQIKPRPTRSQLNKCVKRRASDSSMDQASQRVVLRLTKQNRGTIEGYKVSDISVENKEPGESSSNLENEETLPDAFKKTTDGPLSIIKDGIFLKESEPKLLEEFLNNLNMYGTSKDVAMLVQSNQSYFVKGPVLTAEHCSEALDALASNKEFLDLKNKTTPKKKLKTWQKYLPKKLSKTQQQQISHKTAHQKSQSAVSNSDSSERILNAKDKIKPTKNEELSSSRASLQSQKSGLMKSKNLVKVLNSKDTISKMDDKTKFPNQKTSGMKKSMKSKHLILQKKREIRRRSKLNIGAQLALIEREKRSIRLPARYLDSAVLAAGTEWVSPIFIGDEKKTRKQLLDVLGKITPNKESDSLIEKNSAKVSRKRSVDSDKPQKRASKESVASKKQKNDNTKQNTRIPKQTEKQNVSVDLKDLDEKTFLNEILYSMPLCTCSPCSRTVSFQKVEKTFICFSKHNRNINDSVNEKSNHETESISNEKSRKSNRDSSEIAVTKVIDLNKSKRKESEENSNDHANKKIKSLSSDDSLTAEISNQNKSSTPKYIVPNTHNTNTPVLKKSFPNSSIIITNENSTQSSTKIIYSNPQQTTSTNDKLQHANMRDSTSNEFNNSQILNVSGTRPANKVLLFVPPVNSTSGKGFQTFSPNAFSIQKVQKLTSESRGKPPILARKTVPENQVSSSKNNFVPSSKPSLAQSSFNSTSVLLKLPKVTKNDDKCSSVYGPSQMTSVIKGSSLNSTPSVLNAQDNSNLVSNVPQQKMSFVKAIKLGHLILCPSEAKSSLFNSNLSNMSVSSEQKQDNPTLNVQTSEMLINNAKVPVLQTALKNDSSHSDVSEIEDTNIASNSEKPSSQPVECHRRQSSEHRRKSPLNERKFNDKSDSDVDVDTVDKNFDAVSSLKQNYTECDAEVFNNDFTYVYLSSLSSLYSPDNKKKISERNRRQLIGSMSDKLKRTSEFFKPAKSFAEIINRASRAVHEIRMENDCCTIAKRILQFRNAQLLKKLSDNIQAIPDPKCRIFVKKKLIQMTARAWRNRKNMKQISSPLYSPNPSSSLTVETNSPPNQDPSVLNGSQKDVNSELDREIDGTPEKNNQNECPMNSSSLRETGAYGKSSENKVVAKNEPVNCTTMEQLQTHRKVKDSYLLETDVIEQPHVQLRILEACPNGVEADLQIKEKETECKTSKSVHEEPSPPPLSASRAKRRLPFRGSSDANTSDDDHLIIDLSDDSTNPEESSSSQKDLSTPMSSEIAVKSPTMKKFPGLIPLFTTDLLKGHEELEITKPSLSQTKPADNGANKASSVCDVSQKFISLKTSIPGLMSIQPVEDVLPEQFNKQQKSTISDDGILKGQMNSALTSVNKVLDSSDIQKVCPKNGQTPLSFMPQTSLLNKSSCVNGDIPKHSVDNSNSDKRLHCRLNAHVADNTCLLKQNVPEEIVIDDSDSDDEVLEIKESTLSWTSTSSVQHSHQGLSTEKESRVHL